jgi:hypothetical protein
MKLLFYTKAIIALKRLNWGLFAPLVCLLSIFTEGGLKAQTIACNELTNTVLYVSNPNLAAETYEWVLPSGATIVSRSMGDTSLIVNWTAAARG